MRIPSLLLSFFLLSNFVLSAGAQSNDDLYTLRAGTIIRARMDNEIGSKVSSVNDTFTVTVSSPVVVRENEMLPVGTIIEGRVTQAKPASTAGANGKFEVKFENLRLPNGQTRRLDGVLANYTRPRNSAAKRNFLTILGGTAFGALIGGLAGKSGGALIGSGVGAGAGSLAAVLMKGREARIKSNEEIEISLSKDLLLPVEDF